MERRDMAKATQKFMVTFLALAMCLLGCESKDSSVTDGKPDETGSAQDKMALGKADAWNSRNNPDGLRVQMTKVL